MRRIIIISLFVFLSMILQTTGGIAQTVPESSSFLSDVKVSADELNIAANEKVRIEFKLARPAKISLVIYNAGHVPVRNLAKDLPCAAGLNSLDWNGRDDAGAPVSDEAYYFTIAAVDARQQIASFDPALTSGGERIMFGGADMKFDAASGGIVYELPYAARVQIRLGVSSGPLLKTLVQWAPRKKGRHCEAWDRKDASGSITLTELKDFRIMGRAMALPEKSIIVRGGGAAGTSTESAAQDAAARRTVVESSLAKRARPIEPAAWTPFGKNADPVFSLALKSDKNAGDTKAAPPSSEKGAIVRGETAFEISLDDAARMALLEQRFEIVFFVDYSLIGEVEQGYSPYTWVWDSTTVADGQHVITFNVSGMNDQIGSQSLIVDVQNSIAVK